MFDALILSLDKQVKRKDKKMKISFSVGENLDVDEYKLFTHLKVKPEWGNIKRILLESNSMLPVVDVKTENNIFVKLSSVISSQSEERRCNVVTVNKNMYLFNMRLKKFEDSFMNESFLKVNNGVIINKNYIKEFSAVENARMEVVLEGNSKYFVNRHYLKNFKERLL